jgi:hypothetical protein
MTKRNAAVSVVSIRFSFDPIQFSFRGDAVACWWASTAPRVSSPRDDGVSVVVLLSGSLEGGMNAV